MAYAFVGIDKHSREHLIAQKKCKTFETVCRAVAEFKKVNICSIRSADRHRVFVYPRHMIWYLLHNYYGFTLKGIGDTWNCDHTTIRSGIISMNKLIETLPEMQADLKKVKLLLNIK